MNFNLLYVLIYIIFSLIESKNQSLKSHDYQNGHESWDNNDIFWQTDMAMICKWVGSGSSRDNGHIFYSYMEKVHSPDETTRSGFNIKFSSVCSLFAGRVVGSTCHRVETSFQVRIIVKRLVCVKGLKYHWVFWHMSTEPCLFMRIVTRYYWQISVQSGSLLDWRKYHRTGLQILKITVAERSSTWIFPRSIN